LANCWANLTPSSLAPRAADLDAGVVHRVRAQPPGVHRVDPAEGEREPGAAPAWCRGRGSVKRRALPHTAADRAFKKCRNQHCNSTDGQVPPDDHTKLICTAALWVYPLAAHRSFFVCTRKLAQKYTSLPLVKMFANEAWSSPRSDQPSMQLPSVGQSFQQLQQEWQQGLYPTARARKRREKACYLSAPPAQDTKPPHKVNFYRRTLRPLKRPGRARAGVHLAAGVVRVITRTSHCAPSLWEVRVTLPGSRSSPPRTARRGPARVKLTGPTQTLGQL
jgi:hypothetical protein